MIRPAVTLPALLALLPLTACHVGFRSSPVVDGVRLRANHVETIEVDAWDPGGFEVDSIQGDLHLVSGDGTSRITVTVYEAEPGDARAHYENGVLSVRTTSGQPAGIGAVTLHAAEPLPALSFVTGIGDVVVDGVRVSGPVRLDTGMGDVLVVGIGSPTRIDACSGMGDVQIEGANCDALVANSGMGDIRVFSVAAGEAELDSGMGDVDVRWSSFDRLNADTGMGDVTCRGTSYARGDLDTGLGNVRQD